MTSYACHQLNEARPFVFHYQSCCYPHTFLCNHKLPGYKMEEKNSIHWSWTSCLPFLQHLTRVLLTNQTQSTSLFSDLYIQFPKWHMAWVTLCDCCALTRKHNLITLSIIIHKHLGGCMWCWGIQSTLGSHWPLRVQNRAKEESDEPYAGTHITERKGSI